MINFGLEPVGLAILTVIAWICAVGWLGFATFALYGLAQRKPLPATSVSQLTTNPPLVSILLPARNEAHRVLGQALAAVLAQDYKQIEVIAVNDRSVDSTGSILASLAENEDRLRVINNTEPPAGWLPGSDRSESVVRFAFPSAGHLGDSGFHAGAYLQEV